MIHSKPPVKLEETLRPGPNCSLEASGVTFLNPAVCAAILQDYNNLKHTSDGAFNTDLWGLMFSFDELMSKTFYNEPILQRIIEYKTNGW